MANSRAYLKRIVGAGNNADTIDADRYVLPHFQLTYTGSIMRSAKESLHLVFQHSLHLCAYSYDNSHIFDGETVPRNVGSYQFCDMTDPFLQEMIHSTEFVRETCDVSWGEKGHPHSALFDYFIHRKLTFYLVAFLSIQSRDGWWDDEYIEFIRQILKRKFLALLNDGIKLPNDAFDDLLDHLENYREQQNHQHAARVNVSMMQDEEMEQDAENAEMEDHVHNLGQKKLTSLRSKGKRALKPKAKSVNDGFVSI